MDRVRQDPLLDGQNYIYMHYADMIANGYHRTAPCPFMTQGIMLNPNGDLFFCENSEIIGNAVAGRPGSGLLPRDRAGASPRDSRSEVPDLPEPVPDERRGDQAGDAVRALPGARLDGKAAFRRSKRRPPPTRPSAHVAGAAFALSAAACLAAFCLRRQSPSLSLRSPLSSGLHSARRADRARARPRRWLAAGDGLRAAGRPGARLFRPDAAVGGRRARRLAADRRAADRRRGDRGRRNGCAAGGAYRRPSRAMPSRSRCC